MNKIYRVIWSNAQNTWVAVSEIAKSQGKSHSQVTGSGVATAEKEEGSFFSRTALSAAILIVVSMGIIATTTAHADGGIYINDGTDTNCLKSTDSSLLSTGLTAPLTPLINSLATPIANVGGAVNTLTGTLDLLLPLGGILVTNLPSSASITTSALAATTGTSLVNTAALASVITSANGAGCLSGDAATQTNRILFYSNSAGGAAGTDPSNLSIGGNLNVNGQLFLAGVDIGASLSNVSSISSGLSSVSSGLSSVSSGLSSVSSGLSDTNSTVSSGLSVTSSGLSAVSSGLSGVSSGLSSVSSGLSSISSGLSDTNSTVSSISSGLSTTNLTVNNIINNGIKGIRINNTSNADAMATGDDSVAIGPNALASGSRGIALGAGAQAGGENSVALGAGSIATRANSVSVGAAGSERQITNVAAGTAPTDAVNLSQLESVAAGMDHNVRQLSYRIKKAEDKANAGTAAAMSMGGAPFIAGATTYYIGSATYGGQAAFGVTVRRTADDGTWSIDFGLTGSSFGGGAKIGVSGVIK